MCAAAQGEIVANWTEQGKVALSLARFCVQLDQRMLSLLAQTGAQHAKFFEKAGRARLLKVPSPCRLLRPGLCRLCFDMVMTWSS